MLLRGRRKKVSEDNMKIKMRGSELEVVSEIKYLRVMIDKNLIFSLHVNYLGKK